MPQKQKAIIDFEDSYYKDTINEFRQAQGYFLNVWQYYYETPAELQKSYLFTLNGLAVATRLRNPITAWIYQQELATQRDALLFKLEQLSAYW